MASTESSRNDRSSRREGFGAGRYSVLVSVLDLEFRFGISTGWRGETCPRVDYRGLAWRLGKARGPSGPSRLRRAIIAAQSFRLLNGRSDSLSSPRGAQGPAE